MIERKQIGFSILLLLIHGHVGEPRMMISTQELSDICSITRDPSFCEKTMKSDSRTAGASLTRLGEISIEWAEKSSSGTSSLITSLINQATDPKLKGRYQTCKDNFDFSKSTLKDARDSLNLKDYGGMNIKASAALDGAGTCLDSFNGPPADKSELPSKCEELERLCSIILAISNRLAEPS